MSHEFRLMTFNIEYGGTNVDFGKVVEIIQRANPQVVAVEEAFGNIPRLAQELGWAYYDIRTQLISQLPLIDPPDGNGIYTFVQLEPGRVVAVGNVHLPNDPEGAFAVLRGATATEIIELETKARLPYIQPFLDVLPRLASEGIPVFLAGDFNAPSHLDWTLELVGVRRQILYPMEWTISKAVMDARFRDSFREVHPDPKLEPGLTWWASRPQVTGWNPNPDDPQDRIDFIYAAGPCRTLSSEVIGEKFASPYPSDHRGVLSIFEVIPSAPPILISTADRLVEAVATIKARYHVTGTSGERCGIVPRGELLPVLSQALDRDHPHDGEISLNTSGFKKGAYDLVLLSEDGAILCRYPFWIKDVGEAVKLTLSQSLIAYGGTLDVQWENAPGNRWDWLGIYKAGQNLFVEKPLRYMHTNASIAGDLTFDLSGLEADRYEVLFCIDDNYICFARVPFEIKN
ncbi:MAG TPA: endonuclease/exonuclease/phosphatase family protein [Anaerolineales bacterium]|nr:endonuclease/exonuclease/phosphatase family protein [Anaerolineales bacterium]HNO32186.1 endonuclease/exonuclease/phosphatase family protein [Anaerolineales bacterium]